RVTDPYGTVGGGYANQAGNNDNNYFIGQFATVSGGSYNIASGDSATVSGGSRSTADGELATIGGGGYNLASGYAAVIAGGGGYSASLDRSTPNTALGFWSAIGGGADNTATNNFSVIGGGGNNRSGGIFATIGGGKDNSTSADFATIPGGRLNSARGANSFAAGTRALAADDGAFVWADNSANFNFSSTTADEFAARATGGVRFVTATGANGIPTAGVQLPAGGGAWSSLSDRAAKTNFAPVNQRAILEHVAALPIQTWNYKSQAASVRHIGMMAQDFAAAFALGEDDRHISTVDVDGVALAAIQGLYELVQEQHAEMRRKDTELDAVKARLEALEKMVSKLTGVER
ncbi:MAG: tail fiber domain-containing protein, partial [Verrucomicrobia bacterium]|nr:tail fiber domain-containing protein [Verrucomicrobiota bacterium]